MIETKPTKAFECFLKQTTSSNLLVGYLQSKKHASENISKLVNSEASSRVDEVIWVLKALVGGVPIQERREDLPKLKVTIRIGSKDSSSKQLETLGLSLFLQVEIEQDVLDLILVQRVDHIFGGLLCLTAIEQLLKKE